MTKLFLKLPLRPEYDGEDWRSPEHETASVTGAAPFSDADGQCVGYAVTTGWNDRDADRRDFIVKAVNAHDDLVAALTVLVQLADDHGLEQERGGLPAMLAARAALAKAEAPR